MVVFLSGADLSEWLGSHLLVSYLLLDPSQGPDLLNAHGAENEGMSTPHHSEGHKDPCCNIVVFPHRKAGLIRLSSELL